MRQASAAWTRDDTERAQKGLPRRGVIPLRVVAEEPRGHGQAPHGTAGAEPGARSEGQVGVGTAGRKHGG